MRRNSRAALATASVSFWSSSEPLDLIHLIRAEIDCDAHMSKASTCLWNVSKGLAEIDTLLGRVDSGDMSGGEDFYQDGVFVEHLVKGAVREIVVFSAGLFTPPEDGSQGHVSPPTRDGRKTCRSPGWHPACLQALTQRQKRLARHRALWLTCGSRLQADCQPPQAAQTGAPRRSVSAAINA